MKKLWIFLLAAAMLLALPMSVSAETLNEKEYAIRLYDGIGEYLSCITEGTAFWEYPLLKAGQCRTDGTLIFTNDGNHTVKAGWIVTLPYDDVDALVYLNDIRIELRRDDGTLIYDGPYVHIADNGVLDGGNIVEPGCSTTYHIRMWCDYDYTGDMTESRGVTWRMRAVEYSGNDQPKVPGTKNTLWVLWVMIAAVAALAGTLVLSFVTKKKKMTTRRRR